MNKENFWKNLQVSIKWTILLVVCVFVIFSALRLGTFLSFLAVFGWLTSKFVNAGLGIWTARAIAILPAGLLLYSFALIFSLKKKKRQLGCIIIFSILFLWFVWMAFVQKDFKFDPVSGEPLKSYASTPYGYEQVPSGWKFHPVYGTPVIKGTRSMATANEITKNGLPSMNKIIPSGDSAFFTPDGQPLVWYYEYPDGRIDLFPTPGLHPQTTATLNPVNPEIVKKIIEKLNDDPGKVSVGEVKGTVIAPSSEGIKNLSDMLKKLQK